MGGNCSSQCSLCFAMCLWFPFPTCMFCHLFKGDVDTGDGSSKDGAGTIDADDILKAYGDITVLYQPSDMCDQFHGDYHSETSTCTVDISNTDTILKYVTGIDTPQQLCTDVGGEFLDGKCMINTAQWGQGTIDVKKAACSAREGQWLGNNCALGM